jgi:hypothetical protein
MLPLPAKPGLIFMHKSQSIQKRIKDLNSRMELALHADRHAVRRQLGQIQRMRKTGKGTIDPEKCL